MLMDWAVVTEKFSSLGLGQIRHEAGRLAEKPVYINN